MTEQGYTDYVNATYEGTEIPPTNHFEASMTWLGLAQLGSFDFVPLMKEGVADKLVSYRWRQKELLFIDHGKPAADDAANVELVASMIRWLRDQDTDIAAWTTEVSIFDVDSNWGGDAMYFGEARFYSNRYKAALDGVDPASVDELVADQRWHSRRHRLDPRAALDLRRDQQALFTQFRRARRVPRLAKRRRRGRERAVSTTSSSRSS